MRRAAATGALAVLAGVLWLVLPAAPAAACSCAPELPTVDEALADDETIAVFTDEVTGNDADDMWVRDLEFAVDEVWEGDIGATTTVKTHAQGSACGIDPAEGTELLVFVYESSGTEQGFAAGDPVTGACGGTRPVAEAAALGPGARPAADAPAGDAPGSTPGPTPATPTTTSPDRSSGW